MWAEGFMSPNVNRNLKFLWKSNVVLGSCGLKNLRRRKKVNGLKREKSDQFDPLEASSFSLMKKSISYVVTRKNLGGLWLMLM
jgi:hypothetical protein